MQGVVGLDDLFAEIVEHLAFAGEAEFLFAALNEQRFERALQRTDLLADRRLGDTIDLRGLGETLGFRQVTEDFQAFNLHKQIKCGNRPTVNRRYQYVIVNNSASFDLPQPPAEALIALIGRHY